MTPNDITGWLMALFAAGLAVGLPPLVWQKFRQIQQERAGYEEMLAAQRESQQRNRRMERLMTIDRKLNIRWQRRREREEQEEQERKERGYE